MRVIYCAEPFSPTHVDFAYEPEAEAATRAGLEYGLINFEALVDERKPAAAVRRVKPPEVPDLAVYRGWMLTPGDYSQLYDALEEKGLRLINTPADYKHCHHFPESYPIIKEHTPASVTVPLGEGFSAEEVMRALAPFGERPVVLKDYVKSRKHEWLEACYIPSAADRESVERVVKRFLELQGGDVNEGLVFREFVAFRPLASHSKSGMPLTKEFRLFFLDSELLTSVEYWEEGDYGGQTPPTSLFGYVAREVRSRFFTMDIAQRTDGEWMIVELGDAQVAGLPEKADLDEFYRGLRGRVEGA
ncbi:MAG TPA: ATP-grasp domain-containing protein [Pyrinomonadaceae bacterium]|jgi:hypothetical protein|nr:ATP-grasp domain-containing protein [Pyrinomonadaceae bacterium]